MFWRQYFLVKSCARSYEIFYVFLCKIYVHVKPLDTRVMIISSKTWGKSIFKTGKVSFRKIDFVLNNLGVIYEYKVPVFLPDRLSCPMTDDGHSTSIFTVIL